MLEVTNIVFQHPIPYNFIKSPFSTLCVSRRRHTPSKLLPTVKMDDPALTGNAVLNAAAVWFIFKAIEVIVFVVYDIYSAVAQRIRIRGNPDPPPHEKTFERRRGWMEYVLSGTGFLKPDLCRQRRVLLLLISTIIPLFIFLLELMSITLGNERRTCQTSKDPNVITSPSLVLFGEGRRQVNLSGKTVEEIGFDATRGIVRPCISWSSTHADVNFLSTLCGDSAEVYDHLILAGSFNQSLGVLLTKRKDTVLPDELVSYPVFGVKLQSKTFLGTPFVLGTFRFHSEVVVNGRGALHQMPFPGNQISEGQKNQLIQDFRSIEENFFQGEFAPATFLEDEEFFGFAWDDFNSYARGAAGMIFAVLAQTTREPIKTAIEMSPLNSLNSGVVSFDISCEKDFRLPRTASIIIIVIGVVFRFILIFIPTPKSSVEYALEKSEESPVEQSKATP